MYPVTNISHSFDVAADWGISGTYPIKIICVPAMCTRNGHFAYQQFNFSDYDLVVISDIEYFRQSEIHQWIKEEGIENDLAMSYKEILFLAKIIHKAMNINRSKDGYVISI